MCVGVGGGVMCGLYFLCVCEGLCIAFCFLNWKIFLLKHFDLHQ